MTSENSGYIARETTINAAICGVMGMIAATYVFRGSAMVSIVSLHWDSLPQTLMTTIMSILMPTLLTHRRIKRRQLFLSMKAVRTRPFPLLLAIASGIALLLALLPFNALLLILPGSDMPRTVAIAIKGVYGVWLGTIIALPTLRHALRHRHAVKPEARELG